MDRDPNRNQMLLSLDLAASLFPGSGNLEVCLVASHVRSNLAHDVIVSNVPQARMVSAEREGHCQLKAG